MVKCQRRFGATLKPTREMRALPQNRAMHCACFRHQRCVPHSETATGLGVSLALNLANRYAEMRATARIRERPLFVSPRIPNELELQARWFAGDFGKHFVTTSGEKIDVVQFGTWNRESGR